ncbi:hypothetical protein ZWY2020_019301 [Hordeum vulgare]|nr:hypothetical protein ZWY2020_019301 [Hordeum vulgare]
MADGKLHLPAGYIFNPAGDLLITKYLRPRIDSGADGIFTDDMIHEADVCSAAPGDLVEMYPHARGTDRSNGKGGEWYFFTPAHYHKTKDGRSNGKRQRAVAAAGEGYYWHSEKGGIPVLDKHGNRVGNRRNLSYVQKLPGGNEKLRIGWCMTEYDLDGDDKKQDGVVLCKVCVSRHRSETTYEEVISAPGSRKRKADDVQHPEAPHPQTPRRQQPIIQQHGGLQVQETQRWFMSDEGETLPSGLVDDGSVDPGGFMSSEVTDDHVLSDDLQLQEGAAEDEDHTFLCMLDELLGLCDDTAVACSTPIVSCQS